MACGRGGAGGRAGPVFDVIDDGVGIQSKSESRDPEDPAKKFELFANLSKNYTKWPINDQN